MDASHILDRHDGYQPCISRLVVETIAMQSEKRTPSTLCSSVSNNLFISRYFDADSYNRPVYLFAGNLRPDSFGADSLLAADRSLSSDLFGSDSLGSDSLGSCLFASRFTTYLLRANRLGSGSGLLLLR